MGPIALFAWVAVPGVYYAEALPTRMPQNETQRSKLTIELPWSPATLFLSLVIVEAVLLLIDLLAYNFIGRRGLQRIFDINSEANIPTWFSSTQALFVGIAALLIVAHHYGAASGRLQLIGWIGAALFFTFIAMDDASQIHERLATAWGRAIKASDESSVSKDAITAWGSYYWQMLLLPFFVAAGAVLMVFIHREFGGIRHAWLFFAGIGLFAIAVALDHFDAFEEAYVPLAEMLGLRFRALRHGYRNVEEIIEMFGTTCILVSFLAHYVRLRDSDRSDRLATHEAATQGASE